MDSLDRFLQRLLREGRVVFRGRPAPDEGPRAAAVGLPERAYATYRLDVPGAAIPFDPGVGQTAAELVRQACWALVSREDRPEDLERKLRMPHGLNRPSHHLSADLVLRYLPQVHRRARGVDPADPLVGMLAKILRDWPLSGVLEDLGEGPESPPSRASTCSCTARRARPNRH